MTIVVGIIALLFLGMGLCSLAAPERFLRTFGSHVTGRDGRCEVRAVYGGFGVAMAALLGYVLVVDTFRTGALIGVAVALAGMALGRVVSGTIDRGLSPLMAVTTIGETLAALGLYLVVFG